MLSKLRNTVVMTRFKQNYPNINTLIVVVAIVMVWRGMWSLLDLYIFPGSPTLSALTCLGLGALILFIDDFRLNDLKR